MAKTTYREFGLTGKQAKFCDLYATDAEFFGNGLQSYMEAYGIPQSKWKSAAANSSRLLKSDKVLKYINHILELRGLNDPFVDKQLEFLITQNADFKAKLGAIKEYNALRSRITNKLDITSEGKQLPTPILPLDEVQGDNSNKKNKGTKQKN